MLNWYFEKRGKMQTQQVFLCDFTLYRKIKGIVSYKHFCACQENKKNICKPYRFGIWEKILVTHSSKVSNVSANNKLK